MPSSPTPAPADSITVPTLGDPSELLTAQITIAEENMEKLRPAVEAFRTWEQFAQTLIAARDGSPAPTSNGSRAGRGDRPQKFLAFLAEAGDKGLTISEAAKLMDLNSPNYLYRIVPPLVDAGAVRKDDKRYFSVATPVEAPQETPQEDGESE